MYNSHRGMAPAPNNRLTELLDQIRAEFENQQTRGGEVEQQSKYTLRMLQSQARSFFYSFYNQQHFGKAVPGSPVETSRSHGKECDLELIDTQNTVNAQLQEMEMVRQKVYTLEQNQIQIKQRYLKPSATMRGTMKLKRLVDMRMSLFAFARSLTTVVARLPT